MKYIAFLSLEDRNGDFQDSIEIEAQSKEDARMKLSEMMKRCGFDTELSTTSEEVTVKLYDGEKDPVYYGFDEV